MAAKTQQIALSAELLTLLEWLLQHHEDELISLIHHALDNGLQEELDIHQENPDYTNERSTSVQNIIIRFLATLEQQLIAAYNHQLSENNFSISAKYHVDPNSLNQQDLYECLAKAENALMRHKDDAAAKKLLYKQLLKRWKPTKMTTAQ